MFTGKSLKALAILAVFLTVIPTGLAACGGKATPTTTAPGPGNGSVVNSDSSITAQIKAVRAETSGYPWEADILVETSADVVGLPNPTKDSVGKVVTIKTDEDMKDFQPEDEIAARVKYVGDVPKPGITLYMYDIMLPPR